MTDQEVEALQTPIDILSIRSRDEQAMAGYTESINLVFDSQDAVIKLIDAMIVRNKVEGAITPFQKKAS
jgi:hypothetical protein